MDAKVSPQLRFEAIVDRSIRSFAETRLARRVLDGHISLAHYHAILSTLFHQTYSGPYTFARAAVNCDWRHEIAKEYLLRHAEEERSHWRWILDDLKSTNYEGPNLRDRPPHPTCQAYIGLNYYVAEHIPIARLAIAAVLEGIGCVHGTTLGGKLIRDLHLGRNQATFFLSHGETDKIHSVELRSIIAASPITEAEWIWMDYAAETAGLFYRAMYDHDAFI